MISVHAKKTDHANASGPPAYIAGFYVTTAVGGPLTALALFMRQV